ncbi:MAG: fimbrillin family protein [Bacteroidales bacterium]
MKKLLLITLAAFVMTNCAKESVVDSGLDKGGNKIAFSSYSTITKGTPIANNNEFMANGNIFGVTAFSTAASDAPYMGTAGAGAPIISNGTAWDYKNSGDTRFWPTDAAKKLNFFAYAPFGNTNRVAPAFTKASGMVFTDYIVSTEIVKQDDFMYASALDQTKPIGGTAVNLMFHHAMTQILFKARVKTDDSLYVDIAKDGISLHKIKSKGTFTLSATATAAWAGQSTPTSYTVASAAVTLHGTKGVDVKDVFTTNNVLMLLPQEFAAWDKTTPDPSTQTGGYLSLQCKLYYKDAKGVKQYLKGDDTNFATINVPLSSKDGVSTEIWKMRNKITYTLLIDGTMAQLDPITFTTTVENWNDVVGGDVTL